MPRNISRTQGNLHSISNIYLISKINAINSSEHRKYWLTTMSLEKELNKKINIIKKKTLVKYCICKFKKIYMIKNSLNDLLITFF